MRSIKVLLSITLTAQVMAATAPRPSSDTVKTITDALIANNPNLVLRTMKNNSVGIFSLLTGKNENIFHLITSIADDSVSHSLLEHFLNEELAQENEADAQEAKTHLGVVDSDGFTPLHHSAKHGNMQTTELLLLNDARANVRDSVNKLPRDYAAEEGHNELAEMLGTYAQAHGELGGNQAGEEEEISVPDFLVNLNDYAIEDAAYGGLDPVIGRVDEISSVLEMLGQRRKNNPLLVGAAGVGKTAIIEGIAGIIAKGEAPPEFLNKTIYTLDIGLLLAGTGGRGVLEGRVKEWMQFAKENPDTLYFVDEIHLITTESTGGIAIADLIKPELARGELRLIGATTDAEYRRHILSDKALNRRFMRISIEEPSKEDALEITFGARDLLTAHHGIEISDGAVIAAVELSHYFQEQKLPDVAISLLDEAAAAHSFGSGKKTILLRDIRDKIDRRSDSMPYMSNKRKKQTKEEIQQYRDLHGKGTKSLEKHIDTKIEALNKKMLKLEESEQEDGKQLSGLRKKLHRLMGEKKLKAKHVAEIVSRRLNISVEQILKEEQGDIANIEENLTSIIFGQNESVEAIANTLTVSSAGLAGKGKPLGSFLLLGHTGTGKTHTAKKLAELLFGDEKHLLRFDMSEYSESHTISSLLGAPPGYVGFDQGGTLSSAVLRTPHVVLLFDEAEKAHPQFQNILLQMLDGARVTDRSGETVDFTNVIVVMTSNSDDYKRDFRPEVLNRIDNILFYNKLNVEIMRSLVQDQMKILNAGLLEKGATISLTEKAITLLSNEGYDPDLGARPLHRVFRQRVKLPLAKLIVNGELGKGDYQIDIKDDGVELIKLTKK